MGRGMVFRLCQAYATEYSSSLHATNVILYPRIRFYENDAERAFSCIDSCWCFSQVEKFVLRVELHRWLEDLEDRKGTMMDRKTLTRILQAFQRDGLCKCVLLSMPGLTNCGRQRTVEVVLLPSVIVDLDVLNKVHDRVRKFDMDSRGHGQSKVKGKDDVPILEGVKRMSTGMLRKKNGATKFDVPTDGSWSMQANGFIPAKMVRVSMLHHFLWNYVNNLPDESERLGRSGMSEEIVGSCRIFALSSAIQTMPLELFLQIIGSVHKVDSAPQWCKQGLQLCELPKEAFSILLDTNATGRLSWLVDVLRRLKVVTFVIRVILDLHRKCCMQELKKQVELPDYCTDESALLYK